MKPSEQAYILFLDESRLSPDIQDSREVWYMGKEPISGYAFVDGVVMPAQLSLQRWMIQTQRPPVEEPLPFGGILPLMDGVDLPISEDRLPIFSRRAVTALVEAGPLAHRTLALRTYDDTDLDRDGNLLMERYSDEYVLLQLTERLRVFDFEHAEVDQWGGVAHWALSVPRGGFPPLFRVEEKPGLLFVSGAGKVALERLGVLGVDFEPVECIPLAQTPS